MRSNPRHASAASTRIRQREYVLDALGRLTQVRQNLYLVEHLIAVIHTPNGPPLSTQELWATPSVPRTRIDRERPVAYASASRWRWCRL